VRISEKEGEIGRDRRKEEKEKSID
jgi:hypothetical protein